MKLTVRELVIFAMLGAAMFVSKLIMEIFPNVHIIGVLIVAFTVFYRVKALIPLYVFVAVSGIYYLFFYGNILWWLPYLYIWAVLWAMAMLIPKKMPKWLCPIVYSLVCALHGFLYGTLYAPAQALLFGLDFDGMITWIIAGFPWDILHGVNNFFCGLLICPIIKILTIAEGKKKKL